MDTKIVETDERVCGELRFLIGVEILVNLPVWAGTNG